VPWFRPVCDQIKSTFSWFQAISKIAFHVLVENWSKIDKFTNFKCATTLFELLQCSDHQNHNFVVVQNHILVGEFGQLRRSIVAVANI
jgi:hypothetical protein